MDSGQENILDLTYLSINNSDYTFSEHHIQLISRCVCSLLGLSTFELSINIIDKKQIQELNGKYRSKNLPTDVLSFPQQKFDPLPSLERPYKSSIKSEAPKLLGDVAICPQVANENAQKIGQSLPQEIAFLITHGILHLSGYDHEEKSDEAVMLQQQKLIVHHLNENYSSQMKGLVTS